MVYVIHGESVNKINMENNIEKLIEDKIQELLDKGHKVKVKEEDDLWKRKVTSFSLEKICLWVSTVKNYMAGIGLIIDGDKLLDLRKEFLKQIHSKLITAKEEQQKYSEKKAREKVMKYLKGKSYPMGVKVNR